ncbi:MAG: maleylpyruvate isomerase N-terminal domain-containing protein [Pseudonocardia sp.]
MPNDDQAWQRCQDALAAEVARVTELLRSLPGGPGGSGTAAGADRERVVGEWDLVEVAVHLSQAWIAVPGLARADLSEVEAMVPGRGAGASVAQSIDHLGEVTTRAVAAEPERDPAVLATRIEARAKEYLADCARQDPDQYRPWLISGITVPPAVFTTHLLNETMMHGWDVATAAGRPWPINPAHAALAVRWFLLELLVHGAPELIGDPVKLAALRVRYLFDIRGHGRVRMVFDDAGARLDDEPGTPDCRISLDPVAFLLLFFGRRRLVGTVARGGLMTWGRKPWLGLRLLAAVPTP